jgi:putative ABC transport system permease protein
MQFSETISLAIKTVKGNKLRASITIAIIAFGIMALIGILTAIQAMEVKLNESFSSLGSNSYSINYRTKGVNFGGGNRRAVKETKRSALRNKVSNLNKPITLAQAQLLKQEFSYQDATLSIALAFSINRVFSYGNIKTNPNYTSIGVDENYVQVSGFAIAYGRNFTADEVNRGDNVCIIGTELAEKLFNESTTKPLNKLISVGGIQCKIIGVLKSKGSGLFGSKDKYCFIPYNLERRFSGTTDSYTIAVQVPDLSLMQPAIGQTEGQFRNIRQLAPDEDNNFEIETSDSLAKSAINSLGFISIAAAAIGFITLFGAAVGLMNIMLVAVTERTKEVGLSKALGARKNDIRNMFIAESVIISLFGAFFGIILGVAIGNLVGSALGTSFFIPWGAVLFGIIVCTITGILAGIFPALKAAKLQPIEALRYE